MPWVQRIGKKFAAFHREWWRLHMSVKFSSGMINPKQTNKQTKQNKKKTEAVVVASQIQNIAHRKNIILAYKVQSFTQWKFHNWSILL